MPTVLRAEGYRFFFYSDEGDPREPAHVHVVNGEKIAKFWLEPVELAASKRLRAADISSLQQMVFRHRDLFLEAWHAHFDPEV